MQKFTEAQLEAAVIGKKSSFVNIVENSKFVGKVLFCNHFVSGLVVLRRLC